MRATNQKVIEIFVGRFSSNYKKVSNHSESLRIEGNKLVNYGTTIAEYINGKLFINVTKYSVTTSKLQNMVKRESYQYEEVENIPIGTYYLDKYIKEKS